MLYFAFGSNLNRKQMKRRCSDSKYVGCYTLKNYKLSFRTNNYSGGVIDGGVADIQKKKKSKVLGAIYKISKKDEKKLDVYEDFPLLYVKKYLKKVDIGSYPFFRLGRIGVSIVLRSSNKKKIKLCFIEIKRMINKKKIKIYKN